MRRVAVLVVVCGWLVAAVSATAHPIVIHGGSIRWQGPVLSVELELDPHSLEHELAAVGGDVRPEAVARALAESVHVITPAAARIPAGKVKVDAGGRHVRSEYAVPSDVSLVALVHRPSRAWSALVRQFQLRWLLPGSGGARTVRLTSGGNHVVLRPNDPIGGGPAGDPYAEPVLRLVAADGAAEFGVQVDYPCTLLAMWPGLLECSRGAITGPGFRASRRAIAHWAGQRLLIGDGGDLPRALRVERVDLLGPSGELLGETADGPRSVYTTRVRIHFAGGPGEGAVATELTWKGFNAAILRVAAVDARAGDETFLGVLTPRQGTLRIAEPVGALELTDARPERGKGG